MDVRPYRSEDWSSVRRIYDLAKPDELRGVVEPSDIPRLDEDPEMLTLFRESEILVADDSNQVVGFVGSRRASVTWLFVHPDHRRKGVATALVRSLIGGLRGTITLNVATENLAARQLYERMGFVVEREFMGKFKGHDCSVTKLRHESAP